MRKPCSILLLCVLLCFGVSVVVPAEDVPETAYDESDALPYENTAVIAIAVPKAVVPGSTVSGIVPLLLPVSLRKLGTQRFDHETGRTYPICDSLTILDRSLRC